MAPLSDPERRELTDLIATAARDHHNPDAKRAELELQVKLVAPGIRAQELTADVLERLGRMLEEHAKTAKAQTDAARKQAWVLIAATGVLAFFTLVLALATWAHRPG